MNCKMCLKKLPCMVKELLNTLRDKFSFLGLFGLRLYLAPIMIAAGLTKLNAFENTAAWFGNADWGLGLPFPEVMTALVIAAELGGGLALLVGFMTRLVAIPLMVTMLVAAFSVHWDNGWFAIAPSSPATSMAAPLADVGFPGAAESLENSKEVGQRLSAAKGLLKEHGNYSWLTEKGTFVVLNNGIEFAATYFLMLLMLFFYGGGKYTSVDYWFCRCCNKKQCDIE